MHQLDQHNAQPVGADAAHTFTIAKISGDESICGLMQWCLSLDKILPGPNVTAHEPGVSIIEATLEGVASIYFKTAPVAEMET